MRVKQISAQGAENTFVVIFDKDDDFSAGMLAFAQQYHVTAAQLTAVGAFSSVTLGFFDRQTMDYKHIPINEQVEVLALIGNVALDDGKPKIHAHVVVGKADGTAHGGHVMEAHVWPTLEVVVIESPDHLQRTVDKETGLALLRL